MYTQLGSKMTRLDFERIIHYACVLGPIQGYLALQDYFFRLKAGSGGYYVCMIPKIGVGRYFRQEEYMVFRSCSASVSHRPTE